MSRPALQFDCNDNTPRSIPLYSGHRTSGNVTAAPTFTIQNSGVAPFDGIFDIDEIWMKLQATGADGTDPLTLEMDVLINGVSIFTTKPSIDDAAANGATTKIGAATAPAGVVKGVLKDYDLITFSAGDIITASFTLTRTTPETEMADLRAMVGMTPRSSFDPDHTVNVS